jgi:hypothetical protein
MQPSHGRLGARPRQSIGDLLAARRAEADTDAEHRDRGARMHRRRAKGLEADGHLPAEADLRLDYSPEQKSSRLRRDRCYRISHEAINRLV